ncbi:MAG: helix-turn-helix transcriptional regulator [Inquilinus sp.]|uniref:helix-turn-helix transcriptional regulator n=1 Tax=Inquilinus sp. TaxID=1932117 RepID=UPI003F2C8E48
MSPHQALAEVIGAIGEAGFPAAAAGAVGRLLGFDLAAVIVHPGGRAPRLLFDNFDAAGGRRGIDTYLRVTHAVSPILARRPAGRAFRARDFAIRRLPRPAAVQEHLLPAPEEELGFRTIGWPEGLEEIGLHLDTSFGLVEFGLYRQRPRRRATDRDLRCLDDLGAPMTAAFDKHLSLARPCPAGLTAREQEVLDLLLAGCSSEAVALRLGIARFTVKDHRKRIFRKLGIGSLAELFARCHPLRGGMA